MCQRLVRPHPSLSRWQLLAIPAGRTLEELHLPLRSLQPLCPCPTLLGIFLPSRPKYLLGGQPFSGSIDGLCPLSWPWLSHVSPLPRDRHSSVDRLWVEDSCAPHWTVSVVRGGAGQLTSHLAGEGGTEGVVLGMASWGRGPRSGGLGYPKLGAPWGKGQWSRHWACPNSCDTGTMSSRALQALAGISALRLAELWTAVGLCLSGMQVLQKPLPSSLPGWGPHSACRC